MTIEGKELIATLVESNQPLAKSLPGIERALQTLAWVELAKLHYKGEELEKAMAGYRETRDQDNQAFNVMREAQAAFSKSGDDMSWEKRVAYFGEDIARKQMEPYEEARVARVETMNRFDEFRRKHPLIEKLFDAVPRRDAN
jgi:hypothetical protein